MEVPGAQTPRRSEVVWEGGIPYTRGERPGRSGSRMAKEASVLGPATEVGWEAVLGQSFSGLSVKEGADGAERGGSSSGPRT